MDTRIRHRVKQSLNQIIAREMRVPVNTIQEEDSLQDSYGADSLDSVNVILQLENELGIALDDRVLRRFRRIGDIIDSVTQQVESAHDNRG